MTEEGSGLKKVEQLTQKDLIFGNVAEVKRCEVQQIPP